MNYGYYRKGPVELHASGGVGVSYTASGVAADFFLGNAFSFVRIAIFVTPTLHLTQRQTLQDGYAVGNPKGTLETVPTINRWKYGFALTFTFPVVGK